MQDDIDFSVDLVVPFSRLLLTLHDHGCCHATSICVINPPSFGCVVAVAWPTDVGELLAPAASESDVADLSAHAALLPTAVLSD